MNNKWQEKLDKLDKVSQDSTLELESSRDKLQIDMEKARVAFDEWKDSEIAKGKDLEKIEKKYKQGIAAMDKIEINFIKFFDKLEAKSGKWVSKRREKLEAKIEKG